MDSIIYILIAFFALSMLVFVHELGHYVAAKSFGIKVERFSIGFGKIIKQVECCGTQWAFSIIPLGGYIKMKGQEDNNPNAVSSADDSYNSKKPWKRIIILLAGPMANFFLAFFVYVALALGSAPVSIATDYLPPIVTKITPNSPASKAGLESNDTILSINGTPVTYWYEIGNEIQSSKVNPKLLILRDGRRLTIEISPTTITEKNNFNERVQRRIIGISTTINPKETIEFTPIQSLKYAWHETIKGSRLISKGVQKISTGEISSKEVGGAISIFDIIMKYSQLGIAYLLYIMAIMSINLGIMNLLPIPALDGGHIVFNLYEMIFRKRPSDQITYLITMLGWLFLLGLMGLGLFNDITRIWG